MTIQTENTGVVALLSELAYELCADKKKNSKDLANAGLEKMRKDPNKRIHLQNIEIEETSRDYLLAIDHVKKKKYYISRGTCFNNIRDWLNDFFIAFSNQALSRQITFQKFVEKNIDKHPGYKNITGGHSLGGTVATWTYIKITKLNDCETFNAGSTPLIDIEIEQMYFDELKAQGIRDRSVDIIGHRVKGDFISGSRILNVKQSIYSPTKESKHSIYNFTGQYLPQVSEGKADESNYRHIKDFLPNVELKGVDCILNQQNLNKITGIIISDKSCDFLFQGQNENAEGIQIKDLAVALSVYYDDTIPKENKQISFSLDPTDNNDLKQKQEKVFCPDAKLNNRRLIGGTEFGDILYQSDFLMKQLSLGLNEKRQLLNSQEYLADLGFIPSILDDFSNLPDLSRLWLKIKDVNLNEYKQQEISIKKILTVVDITGEVNAKEMVIENGELKDKITQDTSKKSYKFAKKFSDQYQNIEKTYPIFKRLRQLFKANVLAQWMSSNQIPIDLELVNQIVNKSRIINYDYFSPSLFYSVEKSQGQTTYTRSVVGGVSVSTDIKNFIKASPLQEFDKYCTIPNPLFKRSYCQDCKEELTIDELLFCKDNKILCKEHSGHQCEFCKDIILPNIEYLQFPENIKVHESCFKCDFCLKLISQQYAEINGLFAHPQCAQPLRIKIDELTERLQDTVEEQYDKQLNLMNDTFTYESQRQ